ncbi:hypothetical protein [uncultured Friedmanniella sp.]|uniref:hypothetical protein n=1 Tax=uncultured Friedmanniella sp. TaxID=335381 RepID=UPI0035C9C3AF
MTNQPEAPEPDISEPETEPEKAEPEDTEQLDHAEELIDEARTAAHDALPDTQSDDDLDAPSTSEGLAADEPATPGPN